MRQKRTDRSSCTVRVVYPDTANNEVETAMIAILMESYEDRINHSFAGLTKRMDGATIDTAP